MKKFAIGIPTLNRKDLLSPALMYYCIDMPEHEKYILDNGQQNLTDLSLFIFYNNIKVYENVQNIGVAASWNFLCNKIFEKHEYALILNDDIYLGKKDWEIENLISNYEADFYLNEFGSALIIPKKTFEQVGNFDEEFFPAYYEDTDYEYRLKLLDKSVMKIPFLNPVVNRKNSTIEKDPSLIGYIDKNKERYIQKWGGIPNEEKFLSPFNN